MLPAAGPLQHPSFGRDPNPSPPTSLHDVPSSAPEQPSQGNGRLGVGLWTHTSGSKLPEDYHLMVCLSGKPTGGISQCERCSIMKAK